MAKRRKRRISRLSIGELLTVVSIGIGFSLVTIWLIAGGHLNALSDVTQQSLQFLGLTIGGAFIGVGLERFIVKNFT